jgi:hypothetical protein
VDLIHGFVALGPCPTFYSATFPEFDHKISGLEEKFEIPQNSRKIQKNFLLLISRQNLKVVFLGDRCSELSDSSVHAKLTPSSTMLHQRINTTPTISGRKSVIIKKKGITNLLPLNPPLKFRVTCPLD